MKYLLTILFILGSLSIKAQDDKTISIPFRVAKQIQSDLIAKDSAITMLNIANDEIMLLGRNIKYKEDLIDTLTADLWRCKGMMENEKNLKLTYKGLAEDCKSQYDVLKNKYTSYKKLTKVVSFLGVAVVTGLTAIVLFVK
jgi:hypothetical protein